MLLPELEVDLLARSLLTRLLDIPRCNVGSAEVDSDFCPERALQAVHVGAVQDAVAHAAEQALEVGAAKVCSRLELGEGILVSADGVEHNVLRGVGIHLLSEICVDAQKLVTVGAAERLGFERGEERLEPFE